MYEEDRQKALAMYNRLFDECTNEQGLIQLLASPTRQAVLVARAYDAKERKLQVSSHAREENGESGGVPPFVNVIDKIFRTAEEKGLFKTADDAAGEEPASVGIENQMSFFDFAEVEEPTETVEKLQPAPAQMPVAEEPVAVSGQQPAEEAAFAEPTAAVRETGSEESIVPADAAAETPSEAAACEDLPSEKMQGAPSEGGEAVSTGEDAVDAFINSFSIDEDAGEPQPVEEAPVYALEPEEEKAPVKKRKEKKVMAGWLFLFVLFAVPIGVAGIVVLCVPALLSLAVSGGLAAVGVLAVKAVVSSGFVVLADILLILGAALIIFAFGLLFLWLFVWFIGGAMVGLVQGLIDLGGKWCYKEVAVNE